MSVNQFLTVTVAPDAYPATTALQARLREATGRFAAPDELLGILAFAVLDLETALTNATAERLNLKAYVLELEARMLHAGVELEDPAREL